MPIPLTPSTINWAFTSGDSGDLAFDFLKQDETLTLTYTITLQDDSGDSNSDSTTTTVALTITGTNDSPLISATDTNAGDQGAATEANTTISATGDLTVTDTDLSDTVDASIQSVVITGGSFNAADVPAALTDNDNQALLDMLTLDPAAGTALSADPASGSNFDWSFQSGAIGNGSSSTDHHFNFLAKDETLELTYTVLVTDSSGAASGEPTTDTSTVVVTITGTNDSPDITFDVGNNEGTVSDRVSTTATGTINFDDLDLSNSSSVSHSFVSAVPSAGGSPHR